MEIASLRRRRLGGTGVEVGEVGSEIVSLIMWGEEFGPLGC